MVLIEGFFNIGIGGEQEFQDLNAQVLLDYRRMASRFGTISEGLAMNLIDLMQLLSNIDDGIPIMTASQVSALSARISILAGAISECSRTMEMSKPMLEKLYREL